MRVMIITSVAKVTTPMPQRGALLHLDYDELVDHAERLDPLSHL